MSRASLGAHDKLVNIVKNELINRGYNNIHTFETYHTKYCDGEVDLYAVKDKYILNFEIKCSDYYKSRKKVNYQLSRSENFYFPKDYRVFNFFVYWHKKEPVCEWIKHK